MTTTILLAVPEEPDQDPADQASVFVTYQNVICVSCLPAVRTLLVCLLTVKVIDPNIRELLIIALLELSSD